jgi:hypothetical protein
MYASSARNDSKPPSENFFGRHQLFLSGPMIAKLQQQLALPVRPDGLRADVVGLRDD